MARKRGKKVDQESSIVLDLARDNGAREKQRKKNQRYGTQAVELERLKRQLAVVTKKLVSTEKRCQFLSDSRKELRAVAETNHHATVQAESSATKHSTISSTLAAKYQNVQKVLNLVREEYDTMVQETEQQRTHGLHMAHSMEEMSSNIREEIIQDSICIMSIFSQMDLNGDNELEKHEIIKAITFRPEVRLLIKNNQRIANALKPESLAKAMKKMDADGDHTVSRSEFLQFTLKRISEGEFADAPLHVKAMGLNGGSSHMTGVSGGVSSFGSMASIGSASGHRGGGNKQKESRRTAEKAYKTALMLLVREKNSLSRDLKTLQVVHKRAEKRIVDLESKVQKGFSEIKRLRTMYKTSQKQIAKQKGFNKNKLETQDDIDQANIIKRKQQQISEQLPLDGLLHQVFHREPALVDMLTQAREDNDMEEVTMLVIRCRVFLSFAQSLSKCNTYEEVCSAVLEYVPNMLECDCAYLMLPMAGENDHVWSVLHRNGKPSTVSHQHVGLHGRVQHSAKYVMVEDVNLDEGYDPSVEMETKVNIGIRCILAMPISCETGKGGRSGGAARPLSLMTNTKVSSIPPSFDPAKGKSHQKPIVGILEMINKKIRSGHGLPASELQMKATAAVFSPNDVAMGEIVCKSLAGAIWRVRNLESVNAQAQYLVRLSNMSTKLFKNVLSDDPTIGTNGGPTVASQKVAVPALEDLVLEVLNSTDVRLFISEEHNLRKEEHNPLMVAQKYETKLRQKVAVHLSTFEKGNSKALSTVTSRHRSKSMGSEPQNESAVYTDTESDMDDNIFAPVNDQTCYFYESIDVREEDGSRTTLLQKRWGPTDGTCCGIFGKVVKTRAPVYVPSSYNNPMFNGTVDMDVKGTGMICCPIMNSKKVLYGVLQIAVTGDAHLDSLALMAPSKSGGKFGLIDKEGILRYKGRRGGQAAPREKKIACAVGAVTTVCSQLTIVLEFYRHIYHANLSTILKNEHQLVRLFKLWSTITGKDVRPEIQKETYGWLKNSEAKVAKDAQEAKEVKDEMKDEEKKEIKKELKVEAKVEAKDNLKDNVEEKVPLFDQWLQVYDPASQKYYYQNLLDEQISQWDKPTGFDVEASRKRVKLLMSCGSISDLPHGLALLVATRKIQSVYRAKQARQRMRGLRAEKIASSRPNTAEGEGLQHSPWVEMFDQRSGYPYWYNSLTHETTWEDPKPAEEFERLQQERVENLRAALNDADDMDMLISITQLIPDEPVFDVLRKLAKKKLEKYNDDTQLLRHNQKNSHRGSLRADHIGAGHAH